MEKNNIENITQNSNYFLLTNNFIQIEVSRKLCREFHLQEDNNILINRFSAFNKRKKDLSSFFNKGYDVPILASRFKIVKWINFFIYILYVSIFVLKHGQGNLIIGNYLYHGNRFIANFYSRFFKEIYILDEGTSTLSIYKQRSTQKRQRLIDKVFFTYSPRRPLIFYSSFTLPPNNFDHLFKIDSIFPALDGQKNLKNNTVFFIGCPLVENNIIKLSYFNKVLKSLRATNPNKRVIYMAHPKERLVFDNKLIPELKFEIKKSECRLEEYFYRTHLEFEVLASTVSTGYLYASTIFGSSKSYQTYILDDSKLLSPYAKESAELLYKEMHLKLKGEAHKEIVV